MLQGTPALWRSLVSASYVGHPGEAKLRSGHILTSRKQETDRKHMTRNMKHDKFAGPAGPILGLVVNILKFLRVSVTEG